MMHGGSKTVNFWMNRSKHKLQKQLCGFSCVVADTKKENKEAREEAKKAKEGGGEQATEKPASK